MRILLVDDDTAIIQALLPVLKGLPDAEVRVATSGEKAIENAAAMGGVDLLLTDVVMEPMNGFALREEISSRYPSVRTILMSGYDLSDYPEQTAHCQLISKPFGPTSIVDAIEREFAPPPPPPCRRASRRRFPEQCAADSRPPVRAVAAPTAVAAPKAVAAARAPQPGAISPPTATAAPQARAPQATPAAAPRATAQAAGAPQRDHPARAAAATRHGIPSAVAARLSTRAQRPQAGATLRRSRQSRHPAQRLRGRLSKAQSSPCGSSRRTRRARPAAGGGMEGMTERDRASFRR